MKNNQSLKNNRPVFFRQWTRKKYAAFNSLNKIVKICTLLVAYTIITGREQVSAQTDTVTLNNKVDLEEVEIIGQRSPALYSEVARVITVISKTEIESAPVQSINELLEYALNVDMRQRGTFGVQSDIAIRGGTIDNVLILLNGINITDPQTGHLNLDIPVDIEDIEKIEILNGPAARVYGSNALTGAINILTKSQKEKHLSVNFTGGQFGFIKTGFSASLPSKKVTNHLSYSFSHSDGYTHNTGFTSHNFLYNGSYKLYNNRLEVTTGYNDKEFGANAFYSPKFPDQFEEGKVFFAGLKYISGEKIKFTPSVFLRRKTDHYILIKDKPEIYQNFHRTDVTGINLNWSFQSFAGTTSFGSNLRSEGIVSNLIGNEAKNPVSIKGEDSILYDHAYIRTDLNAFVEHTFYIEKLRISTGLMINRNSDYPEKTGVYPGADVSYTLPKNIKLFASYNRAVHFPTFTDLFYKDPTNEGNLNLKPNKLYSFEAGFKVNREIINAQAAWFYNSGKDIIDWLWNTNLKKFNPVNIPQFYSSGIELDVEAEFSGSPLMIEKISFNYAFTDVQKSISDSLSKYYNLRHKLNFSIHNKIFKNLKSFINLSYQQRTGDYITFNNSENLYNTNEFKPFFLLDGRIYWRNKNFLIFTEASNILNTRYVDSGSLTQPGRWFRAGIKITL